MKSKTAGSSKSNDHSNGTEDINRYSTAQTPNHALICGRLHSEIDAALPKATSKIWHSMPVWFIGDNPVVGYKATPKHVNLLFWSGRLFDEQALKASGKFKAAQIQFVDESEIDLKALRRWLRKAAKDIWDYRGCYRELKGNGGLVG